MIEKIGPSDFVFSQAGAELMAQAVAAQALPTQPQWPADKVERRDVSSLIPYAGNPNTHPPAQIEALMRSILKWGWTTPILVDEGDNLIAGHGRVIAAQRLGLKTVPVMVAIGWSQADKQAYVIADNKLPQMAEWDHEILTAQLGELARLDYDLSLTGFGEVELKEFLTGLGDGGEASPKNRELSVDETELLNSAWLVHADELAQWLEEAKQALHVMSPNFTKGALLIHFLRARFWGIAVPRSASVAYTPHRIYVSGDNNAMPWIFGAIKSGAASIESLRFGMQDRPGIDRLMINSIPMRGARSAQDFPADLARDLIDEFCPAKGRVLDPCHGWGGRMLGFMLSGAGHYRGFDVDARTRDGVRALFDDLRPFATKGKTADLTLEPFEDGGAKLKASSFDFALTSPPYFDTEKYEGEQSSFRRWPQLDSWFTGFYAPLVTHAARALKAGAAFALQVGNQRYPLEDRALSIAQGCSLEFVEKRHTGMINNLMGTDPEDGEHLLIFRKK